MGANKCGDGARPTKPANGELPLLVILWDPQDPNVTVKPTLEQVDELVFGAKPSIADYFETQSFGKVKLVKAGSRSFLADKPRDHYWNHPQPGTPGGDEFISGHVEKWTEAIRKADKDFNFAAYDYNGDKILSPTELGILIVIPQMSPFGTNRGVLGRQYPSEQKLVVDGMTLTSIAEIYAGSSTKTKGIPMNFGVTAHELGHLFFKMLDLYFNNPSTRPGNYSIMDVTYTDAQVDPYHRVRAGWMKPTVITESGTYSLSSVEQSGELLKIVRKGAKPSEYFILENRQHGQYDNDLPDTGLAIWRFIDNEKGSNWVEKNINLIRAPGSIGDRKALWHSPESPDATDLKWSDGTPAGIVIRDISPSASVMSFTVEMGAGGR